MRTSLLVSAALAALLSPCAFAASSSPLLLVLDVLALRAYKDGYDKALLRQLLPWSMLGIVIGFFLFK